MRHLFGILAAAVLVAVLVAPAALAQAADDGPALTAVDGLTFNDVVNENNLHKLRELGQTVFTTPFNTRDGLGDGPYDAGEFPNFLPGNRPTLQGPENQFLRVNGLDAQSCNECHVIVSHATSPPTLGIAGVGGVVNQAIILPTLIDVADSQDDRVTYVAGHVPDLPLNPDGVADFNGRFANPPFLFGGGGVEMLAKEMTAELQGLLQDALAATPGTVTPLVTKGVDFGYITTIALGEVEFSLEGVGPIEIDEDNPENNLIVTPFGRKGENFTMRDFDRGAMQFHFGMQPVEVVGFNNDGDGDGVVNEVTEAEMSVLHIFDVTNPPPVQAHRDAAEEHGSMLFNSIGCTDCHRPVLYTESRFLPLAHPEVPTDPSANVYKHIDLKKVGFKNHGSGVAVPLFSDLKHHDMGPRLAETFHNPVVRNEEFVTARLWGIADTAPYLHDGRAPTLWKAIEFHGGEAATQRASFLALSVADQKDLIAFLKTLRTPGIHPKAGVIESGDEIAWEQQ